MPCLRHAKDFRATAWGIGLSIYECATEIAGVAVSKRLCDLRNVQILLDQQLQPHAGFGYVRLLGKRVPCSVKVTLERSGAHAHSFVQPLQGLDRLFGAPRTACSIISTTLDGLR